MRNRWQTVFVLVLVGCCGSASVMALPIEATPGSITMPVVPHYGEPASYDRDPSDMSDMCNVTSSHWPTSMFCQANMTFHASDMPDPAPPPVPPIPSVAPDDFENNDTDDYWLRYLPTSTNGQGKLITCFDGTTPTAMISKARVEDEYGNSSYLESNKWLFYTKGGGNCSAGGECAEKYFGPEAEQAEMTSALQQFKKRNRKYNGIMSSNSINPFSEFNRVVIEKCSFDRFNGNIVERHVESGSDVGWVDEYDRRQMGFNIVNAFLDQFRSGWWYQGWDLEEDRWNAIDLPPLEIAEQILFLGTSGAAHGLYHNIDRFSNRIRGWQQDLTFEPEVPVRIGAIFDSNFMPSLDGEDGDVYSRARNGTTYGIPWDDHIYHPPGLTTPEGGAYFNMFTAWNGVGDLSCRQHHAFLNDEYICMDRHHVLANHVTTDFIVLQDHWDPNVGHCKQDLAGYRPDFADVDGTLVHDCGVAFEPDTPNPYGDLVDAQANDIANAYDSPEINGAFLGSAPAPTRYFVGLTCNTHEHLIKNFSLDTTLINYDLIKTDGLILDFSSAEKTLGSILDNWMSDLGSGESALFTPANGWLPIHNSGACIR